MHTLPNEQDIQWVKNAMFGRHTQGADASWEQNKNKFSLEDIIKLSITIWEAGKTQ